MAVLLAAEEAAVAAVTAAMAETEARQENPKQANSTEAALAEAAVLGDMALMEKAVQADVGSTQQRHIRCLLLLAEEMEVTRLAAAARAAVALHMLLLLVEMAVTEFASFSIIQYYIYL